MLHTRMLGAQASLLRPERCTAPGSARLPIVHLRVRRVRCQAADNTLSQLAQGPFGLILECDGAVVDVHNDGHREAFNRAFAELNYDCIQWPPAVYNDLLRWGDGTGQGLIKAYFSRMGWPLMLSSKDRAPFVQKVYEAKQRHLKSMVAAGEIPLRQGVREFIDEALEDGCKVVILAATSSSPSDSVISSAMLNLGPARALKVQTVTVGLGPEEQEGAGAFQGQGEAGGSDLNSFERQVAAAQAGAKKDVAMSFVRAMHLKGVGMGLDPTLQAAAERVGLVSPALLAAIMAALGISLRNACLVAANHSVMESAKTAGIGWVAAVPPKVAARGGYTAADASYDGYGAGGGATWRKLKATLAARRQQAQN